MSDDGNTIIAGAWNQGSAMGTIGRVQVFTWNGTAWVQKGQNIDGMGSNDRIGLWTAISGNANVIAIRGTLTSTGANNGANRTTMYQYQGTSWVQLGNPVDAQSVGDANGYGLSLSNTGETILMGSPLNGTNQNFQGHIRVYRFSEPLGINTVGLDNVTVFPNPTNGTFAIDLGAHYSNVSIEVYSVLGQLVFAEQTDARIIHHQIDGAAGLYFVKIKTADGHQKIIRLIKK